MADAKLSSEEKIWGAVSYLWILSLLALAARKDNSFIRFHANQGVLLLLCWLAGLLTGPLMLVVNLVIGVIAIVGIIKALQGEKWEIPLVGQFAQSLGDWIIKTLKI